MIMNIRSSCGVFSIALIVALAWGADACAQNLVQDPGFESSKGTFTNPFWTIGQGSSTRFFNCNCNNVNNETNPSASYNGTWSVAFPATTLDSAVINALTQLIQTTPGTTYLVSFFLSNDAGPTDYFAATFGGKTVATLTDSQPFNYRQYSALVTATSTSSTLSFVGEQVPGALYLDDVSVTAEGAPAPNIGGGLSSFAAVFAGFALHRLRRRSQLL
jgi:hypothetical protein